jgi:hypothetical protein
VVILILTRNAGFLMNAEISLLLDYPGLRLSLKSNMTGAPHPSVSFWLMAQPAINSTLKSKETEIPA